ncbi:exodeoxyribonuclease V subunit beta [Granulicella sp. S190]|uniref:UvrD-helicase domain-containing protein n=1 Tax=Granulicella sp. S190 TaxID=1747226 RepID=UPI00131C905F|nr:UvrD-helicase domain-containing protein [Granulicella sp. S190]
MADLFLVPQNDTPQKNQSDSRPPDWHERERALDVQRSWIVEAPAGSGKTGLLIQRYLKLLADESVEDPTQILAITFTVKATNEMRERVLAQLESASRHDPLKGDSAFASETRALAEAVLRRDALLGWDLLLHPRRLNIRTIDSVCGEIARLLPVLSGGGGRLTPVKDPTLMYREAARATLMQLGGQDAELDNALRTVLLHRDGSLRDCERLLMEMLPLRNQWGELAPMGRHQLDDAFLDETVLPKLEWALEQAIYAGLTRLSNTVPADILQELTSLAGEMGHAEGYKGNPSPIAMCADLHTAPQQTSKDLEHWQALIHLLTTREQKWRSATSRNHLGFEIEKKHAIQLKLFVQELRDRDGVLEAIKSVNNLPPAQYPEEQWVVAKALFRILNRALVELQLIFAQRGECDFAELGLLAQVALRRDGAVADLNEALGMKLRHLLVDEMQDTSTSQYELIQLLTQGWDGHSQTVFLVGDPKQSIYLFRQARVERFVRTMQSQQLGDLPVGRLQLTANFRSQRELVEAFNEDFSLLFPREVTDANAEEVPYVEAQAVRGSSQSGSLNLVWHAHVLPAGASPEAAKKAKRRQVKSQAEQIRDIVEQWRNRPLPHGRSEPWKMAVLVRSRNLLADIVAEFKDESKGSLPFRAVDIEALGERQEVLDLFAVTRALLHPADRVAWLAVLHSPLCGLGLADLHLLTGADDPKWSEWCIEDLVADRANLLSAEACERLRRAWPVLQAASESRSELTAAQSVERTWRSLGGDAFLKSAELANARRYFQLLDELEQEAVTIDVTQLKHRLGELFAQPASATGAVDLMTIHGAKGLEWDVVMVPGLEKKAPIPREKLLTWSEIDSGEAEAAQMVLAPIPGRGEGSKDLNNWLKSLEKAREAAERKRLFYVACTRAREELHLFASPEETSKGQISRPSGSLLATAWPAAERHFQASPSTQEEQSSNLVQFEQPFLFDIAANADEDSRPAMLQRQPLRFKPEERFLVDHKLSYGEVKATAASANFARPEGSFEARTFGNAVHVFLETLAKRLTNTGADALLPEVAAWTPRIIGVLRASGLPPAAVGDLASRVKAALINTLRHEEGRWLLSQREQASSELALTTWTDTRSSVRLDRLFLGGPSPMDDGTDHLWIIDYKTATHGRQGIDEFLAGERAKYDGQMQTYAQLLKGRVSSGNLRVGLYYPLLSKLVWWVPEID